MAVGFTENKPYIGFTGNNQIEGVQTLATLFHSRLPLVPTHQGMMGFLVNQRSVEGQKGYDKKFPSYDLLPDLLAEAKKGGLTSLHYVPQNPENIPSQIAQMLNQADLYGQGLVDAVQLNNIWPEPQLVDQIKNEFPGLKTIIQANRRVLGQSNEMALAHDFKDLDGLVDYLLFDPSAGKGETFDAVSVRDFFTMAGHFLPHSAIILAGGFDSFSTAQRIEEIAKILHSKKFGIDAQTGLRDYIPKTGHGGDFSIIKAERYLDQAISFFRS